MKQGVRDGENICARGKTALRALIKLSFSQRSLTGGAADKASQQMDLGSFAPIGSCNF